MPRIVPRLIVGFALVSLAAGAFTAWHSYRVRRDWAEQRPPAVAPVGAGAPGLDARLAALSARLDRSPPDEAALSEYARVCHANGQLEAAAAAYATLRELQPAEPRWPYLLAIIVAGYGRLDEATPMLERATQLAPGYVTAWLRLGDAQLKSNALDAAARSYQHAAEADAGNPWALLGLARCDLQAERLTAARSRLQQAVADRPDFVGAQSLLAMVYDQLGNPEAAAAARARVQRSGHYTEPPDPWMEELIFECHDPYALLTAASGAVVEEKWDRAFALLQRGLTLAPGDARLHRQLGRLLTIRGRDAEARRELEAAVALDPANEAIRFDLIKLLGKLRDEAAINTVVEAGLRASPESAGLHFAAGRRAAREDRLADAERELAYSWRLGPDQPAAGLELADVLYRTDRYEAAVALLEEVQQRFPKESTASLILARHGIGRGDDRARAWLQRAIDANAPLDLVSELRSQFTARFGAAP
jgi:predicted Zn-dependent protease